MTPDYHQKQMFRVWATPKTIEDFSYLPGETQVERFERVVALGLREAEKHIDDAPAKVSTPTPVAPTTAVKRASLDAIMTQYSGSTAPGLTPKQSLVDFSDEDIIAYVRTWERKPSFAMIRMLRMRCVEMDWTPPSS